MAFLNDMHLYFRGEKAESGALLLVTLALLVAGLALAVWVRQPFTRGLGAVLLVAALIGGVVGATVYLRTNRQVAQLTSLYESNSGEFARAEGGRMDTVVASFRLYRIMYTLAGVVALILVSLTRNPMLHGVAVGLFLFAAMGFTIDHYAEERARWYAGKVHAQAGPE
jgi:phosphate/sulfate permease